MTGLAAEGLRSHRSAQGNVEGIGLAADAERQRPEPPATVMPPRRNDDVFVPVSILTTLVCAELNSR